MRSSYSPAHSCARVSGWSMVVGDDEQHYCLVITRCLNVFNDTICFDSPVKDMVQSSSRYCARLVSPLTHFWETFHRYMAYWFSNRDSPPSYSWSRYASRCLAIDR